MHPGTGHRGHRFGRASGLALVAIVGVAFYVAVVVALPFLRPDYSPVEQGISEYAVGPYGYLQSAAFVSLGVGSLALAFGVRRATVGSGWARLGSAFVGAWGICLVLSGVFPIDVRPPVSPSGAVHVVVGTLATLSLLAGIFSFSVAFGRDQGWRGFRVPSLALGFSALAVSVGTGFAQSTGAVPPGLIQRALLALLVAWLFLAALRLRRTADR